MESCRAGIHGNGILRCFIIAKLTLKLSHLRTGSEPPGFQAVEDLLLLVSADQRRSEDQEILGRTSWFGGFRPWHCHFGSHCSGSNCFVWSGSHRCASRRPPGLGVALNLLDSELRTLVLGYEDSSDVLAHRTDAN